MQAHNHATIAAVPFRKTSLDLFEIGVLAITLALFGCSSMLLTHLGFNYASTGGSALEKIHPATTLTSLLLAWMIYRDGFRAGIETPLLTYPQITIAFLLFGSFTAYVVIALGMPFTFVIDTLFLPLCAFLILARLTTLAQRHVAWTLHAFMIVNAVLAIIEMLSGWRLVPFYLPEGAVTWDPRSTALLGHPLANANLTAVYIILLAVGAGAVNANARALLILLQLAAMVAFGGRAAAAVAVLVVAAVAFVNFVTACSRNRFRLSDVIKVLAALPILGALIFFLYDFGFFNRFVERVVDDQGSAETRSRMFDLFESFNWGDLMLGPDGDVLGTLRQLYGLDYGIESFVISYMLNFGFAAAAMVFAGLIALSIVIYRVRGWRGAIGMGAFFAINATSTGISGKSIALAQVVILVMALLDAKRSTSAGAAPSERVQARGYYGRA